MKLNKKKVFALALAVCLIATLSMGSLAWFTDGDDITNDFLIAGSDDTQDPDKVFSVEVWENTPDANGDEDGFSYENILPGDALKKEVRVENTGSYDQYIRVIVVVSNASAWRASLNLQPTDPIPELGTIVSGLVADAWVSVEKHEDTTNDNFWYVLYAKEILPYADDASTTDVEDVMHVFDKVVIPTTMTREDAAAFAGGFEVSVLAQAVQTENVGVGAVAAFTTVNMTAQAAYEAFIAPPTNP